MRVSNSSERDGVPPPNEEKHSPKKPSKLALLLTPAHRREETDSSHARSSVQSKGLTTTKSSRRPSTVWSQDSWVSSSFTESPHAARRASASTTASDPEWCDPPEVPTPSSSEFRLDCKRRSPGSTGQLPHTAGVSRSNSLSSTLSKSSSSNILGRISHPRTPDEPFQPALLLSVREYNRSLPPTPLTDSPCAEAPASSSRGQLVSKSAEEEHLERERRRAARRAKAVHELVSTEATYAQDLVVIRDIYKACAEGKSSEEIRSKIDDRFDVEPNQPSTCGHVPSWTATDVQQIFLNIDDLAPFSEELVGVLDAASGESFGLQSDDTLGEAFLQSLPRMQQLYQPYVEKHAGALRRLDQISPESLEAYSKLTGSLAQGLTQSWSLNSLLIKPIQRCLKYPLLLQAIMDLTPEDHPDLSNLRQAHVQSLNVASALNEGRRARELVERVLRNKGNSRQLFKKRKSDSSTKEDRKAPPPLESASSSGSIPQSILKKWGRKSEKTKNALGFESAAIPEASHSTYTQVYELVTRFDLFESQLIAFGEEIRNWSASAQYSMQCLNFFVLASIETCRPLRGEQYEIGGVLDSLLELRRVLSSCESDVCKTAIDKIEELLPALEKLIYAFKSPRKIISKRNLKLLDFQTHRANNKAAADSAAADFTSLSSKLHSELPVFLSSIERAFQCILASFASVQSDYFRQVHLKLEEYQNTHLDNGVILPGELLLETWHAAHVIPRQQFLSLPSCRTDEEINAMVASRGTQPEEEEQPTISTSAPNTPNLHMPVPRSNVRWTPPANRDSVVSSNPSFVFSSPSRSSTHMSSEVDHLPVLFSAVVVVDVAPVEKPGKDYPSLASLAGEEVAVLVEEDEEEPLSLVRNSRGEVGYLRTSELVTLRR